MSVNDMWKDIFDKDPFAGIELNIRQARNMADRQCFGSASKTRTAEIIQALQVSKRKIELLLERLGDVDAPEENSGG